MRRMTVLRTLFVLSAGVGLRAQSNAGSTPAMAAVVAAGQGCPVLFNAQLNGRAIARPARDAKRDDDAPLLMLSFGRVETPRISGATVTVHGLSATSRYLPVVERAETTRTQTFELDRKTGGADLRETEVTVTKMVFVRWAEVTELRYADGSAWHASGDAQCRAVPSGFRPVDVAAR